MKGWATWIRMAPKVPKQINRLMLTRLSRVACVVQNRGAGKAALARIAGFGKVPRTRVVTDDQTDGGPSRH